MKSSLKFAYLVIAIIVMAIIANSFMLRNKVITQTTLSMGTTARITVVVDRPSKKTINKAYSAIEEAFSLLRNYEEKFDFYSLDSELTKVNKSAAKTAVRVSEELLDILERALEYSKLTKGVFDITATSLQKEDGYGSIMLNRKKSSVFFSNKHAAIDLGGIATGYVLDKIAERFAQLRIKNYLIDIGGDIYAHGVNDKGKFWQVGVRNPLVPDKIIEKISVKNQAITTSGNYVKKHIIDTRSKKIAGGELLSVTVVAPTGIDADVLATAFFVMGIDKAKEFIMNKRNDIKAVFIIEEKRKPKAIIYNLDN